MPGTPFKRSVQSHDILYKVSRDWTLSLGGVFDFRGRDRSEAEEADLAFDFADN
jgi:hypothetical protein